MRATIRDVARAAGVSVTTASRALNDKEDVHVETRRRVQEAAESLEYVPSSVARGLVSGHSRTIGVVIHSIASPVYAEVVQGIESILSAAGYSLLLCDAADSQERALECLHALRANHVEGVIMSAVQKDRSDIRELQAMKLPFVLVMRHYADIETDYVIPDHERGAYLVMTHLLSLGHRRIAHVAGLPHASSAQGRLAGYRKAMSEWAVPFDETLVRPAPFTVRGGYEASRPLLTLPHRPTAVYAGSDLQAVGAMKAARELGLKVPDELALAGGDDIELAEFLEIPLTTFRVPQRQIGAEAAAILLAKLKGESEGIRQVVFDPELVIRRSSGGPIPRRDQR